jgi:hypothetical protein
VKHIYLNIVADYPEELEVTSEMIKEISSGITDVLVKLGFHPPTVDGHISKRLEFTSVLKKIGRIVE